MVAFTTGAGAGPDRALSELVPLNSFGLPVTPVAGQAGSPEAIAAAQASIANQMAARKAQRAAALNDPDLMVILSATDENGVGKVYDQYSLGPNPNAVSSTGATQATAPAQAPAGTSPFVAGPTSTTSPYDTSNLLTPGMLAVETRPTNGTGSGPRGTNVTPAAQGMLGAGNANYNSALIRSLRQSSVTPFSSNPGVNFYANKGNTQSNWTPPAGQGSAFSPQVFNQRAATPQEINDYNAYSAYRSSSVGASSPYLSIADWINAGRPTGVEATPTSGQPPQNPRG